MIARALRQIVCHGASHFQPDLIVVAADVAGAAHSVDICVDSHNADSGGDGLLRCLGAAVVIRSGEDHDIRLFLYSLPDERDLPFNVNLGRSG